MSTFGLSSLNSALSLFVSYSYMFFSYKMSLNCLERSLNSFLCFSSAFEIVFSAWYLSYLSCSHSMYSFLLFDLSSVIFKISLVSSFSIFSFSFNFPFCFYTSSFSNVLFFSISSFKLFYYKYFSYIFSKFFLQIANYSSLSFVSLSCLLCCSYN